MRTERLREAIANGATELREQRLTNRDDDAMLARLGGSPLDRVLIRREDLDALVKAARIELAHRERADKLFRNMRFDAANSHNRSEGTIDHGIEA